MADDLVKRLRDGTYDKSRAFDWMNEAADRIEQLEEALRSQMNMRDHFAAQIACGMAAHSGTMGFSFGPESIAKRSYEVADRMLKVRTLPEGEVKDD